jgi:hypothetical protein
MLRLATCSWNQYDLTPVIHSANWENTSESFQQKLQRLVRQIDSLSKHENFVSLVGTSAGGSMAVNALIQCPNTVQRVINVCGRLRVGTHHGFRSFELRTNKSPAFAESVKLCEKNEKKLTNTDRKKIMTISALFGDELVPKNTIIIRGARNTTNPVAGHVFCIALSVTMFKKSLIEFLKRSYPR